MKDVDQVQVLAEALCKQFPEARERMKKTFLTKKQENEIWCFVAGCITMITADGTHCHPLITINMACGRADRLFKGREV